MEKSTDGGRAGRQKRQSDYIKTTVSWHSSLKPTFDPVKALRNEAETQGLVVTEVVSHHTGRLAIRIDSPESRLSSRAGSPLLDKASRANAAKLLRRAMRDPEAAAIIKSLLEKGETDREATVQLSAAMEKLQRRPKRK